MAKLPAWARRTEAAAETPWTVGIEEEVMLLDPGTTWSLANRIDAVLAALPRGIATHASAETHAMRRRAQDRSAPVGRGRRGPRYRHIAATMGALAHREPTMAQHVHVAVPDVASAVRALDGLRNNLPLLFALSANSPFWRGGDGLRRDMHADLLDVPPRRSRTSRSCRSAGGCPSLTRC